MKKYFVLAGLLLLLASVFLGGHAFIRHHVEREIARLRCELNPVQAGMAGIEVAVTRVGAEVARLAELPWPEGEVIEETVIIWPRPLPWPEGEVGYEVDHKMWMAQIEREMADLEERLAQHEMWAAQLTEEARRLRWEMRPLWEELVPLEVWTVWREAAQLEEEMRRLERGVGWLGGGAAGLDSEVRRLEREAARLGILRCIKIHQLHAGLAVVSGTWCFHQYQVWNVSFPAGASGANKLPAQQVKRFVKPVDAGRG